MIPHLKDIAIVAQQAGLAVQLLISYFSIQGKLDRLCYLLYGAAPEDCTGNPQKLTRSKPPRRNQSKNQEFFSIQRKIVKKPDFANESSQITPIENVEAVEVEEAIESIEANKAIEAVENIEDIENAEAIRPGSSKPSKTCK